MGIKIIKFLESKKFFWLIVAFFVFEAAWIAISSSYPMVFDEDFHFGIIKLYSHQLSPFFAQQPAGSNAYGSLTSDPSYLYHYLMSFPYRLISLVTHYQPSQIVFLRLIDVMLMAWGLVLFRALLLKTKTSHALVNVVLLFFILVPVVPLLAGQINYDDLLIPLSALAMLTSLEVREQLLGGRIPGVALMKLCSICMLASLVQFEFLPIFAAISLYVGYHVWRLRKDKRFSRQNVPINRRAIIGLPQMWALVIFLGAFFLFGGRYGINLVDYKSPVPQCNQVLTVSQCSAYTPWLRNYTDALTKTSVDPNPLPYTANWFYGMFYHSFYMSSSGANSKATYVHVSPLPIISVTAIAVLVVGVLLLLYDVFKGNTILRQHQPLGYLLFISIFYCVVLWGWNYHDYLHLGSSVALNGRYLFPVMPPFLLALGLAYRQRLRRAPVFKPFLFMCTLLLFMQGGGLVSFIADSNTNWYWSQAKLPRVMNTTAQKIVSPLLI